MDAMRDTKIGGLLLVVSSVMGIVFYLLAPGGPLIDAVDQLDFIARSEALAANASLTYIISLLVSVAILLFLYGLVIIWKATPAEDIMGPCMRVGILMVAFGSCCLIVTMGINYTIVHVLQNGVGSDRTAVQLQDLALILQSAKFGLRYIADTVAVLGWTLISLGMATTLPAGFNRRAAQVMFVFSLPGLIILLFTEHVHDVNIPLIYQVDTLVAGLIFVWVIVLGVGFYNGTITLAPSASAERVLRN